MTATCPDCGAKRDRRALRCRPCKGLASRLADPWSTVPARFAAKTEYRGPGECWPWLGSRNDKGYGHIKVGGSVVIATHVALWLAGRPLTPGMFARHTCDNPPCVNPSHLVEGSAYDNAMDAVRRGRHARFGFARDAHPMRKIAARQVPEIVALVRAGLTQRAVADRFGVSDSTIRRIVR